VVSATIVPFDVTRSRPRTTTTTTTTGQQRPVVLPDAHRSRIAQLVLKLAVIAHTDPYPLELFHAIADGMLEAREPRGGV
jgi:hypothetical protein